MIIDAETWKPRPNQTDGIPTFVSWKRLKELMIGKQKALSIEIHEEGFVIRIDAHSYDERGKHVTLMDKQV